jgi:hypothetical protein
LETGERGADLFSKAALNIASGWSAFAYLRGDGHPGIIQKASSEISSNALSAGFQFTEFLFSNNIRVKVNVNSFYDDPVKFLAA